MSDTLSLTEQLASRTKTFIASTGLSQKELARLLKVNKSHFSRFLSGKVGLNSDTVLQLVRLMNLSPRSLGLKFGAPERTQARLMHLQENGKQMRLSNDGWVSGQSGTDPNDTTGIDGTPTARDVPGSDDYLRQTIGFLKDQQSIYRSAIAEIDKYLAGIQKAKPNKDGVTEGPRRTDDNERSQTPGPRPDRFSLQKELERVQQQRRENEEELRLRQEIASEKARNTETVMQLLAVEPESVKLERAERIRKMALGTR